MLSSGEQTRLSLAKAMLNQPRLLLLDEPTASIDPSAARDIRAGIAGLVESADIAASCGRATTWYEVEAVCDRVLFLSHGRIVLEGDPKTAARASTASETLDDLFVTVAHEALRDGRRGDEPLPHRRDRAAHALSLPRQPAAACSRSSSGWRSTSCCGASSPAISIRCRRAAFNFVPALLGAVLLWDFLTRVMQGVTMAFFEDVWSRNFLNLFATPLRDLRISGGTGDRRGRRRAC